MAGERVGDLAGRVRTAHVRIPVVDADDLPAEGGFERLAGSLRLGQLRHEFSLVGRFGRPPVAAGAYCSVASASGTTRSAPARRS